MQHSQGLNVSLEERVRRKLILTGKKLFDLGQGAIGKAIGVTGAGQFGRLHKEALSCTAALGTIIRKTYAREQTCRSGSQRSENDRAQRARNPQRLIMCEWRRIQTKRKRKLKSFPGAQGVKMMSRLEPLRFSEPGQGSGSEQTTGDVGHFPWLPTQPANDWCRFYRGECVWYA